ncbi:hypothetical protein [Microvirga brassicacearum]|uniref:Uncharacterized protein n=1 Tax=Microvirga brassicacearum TaxID=2580413 RepID=A0A5N3P902_9HYPH|nr:hypothetical protein [Microvirga brassicacearum]KAB0266214.1 hypothetical protein FEZ63_15780 [Microvirga brassicacearum]
MFETFEFGEAQMAEAKKPEQGEGMASVSVNSSRRSGMREDGTGNPAHETGERDSNKRVKVPDQQIPVEQSPEIEDTEGHPS